MTQQQQFADRVAAACAEFNGFKTCHFSRLVNITDELTERLKKVSKKHGVSERAIGNIIFQNYGHARS